MNVFQTAKGVSMRRLFEEYTGTVLRKRTVSGLSCPFCGHNGCFGLYSSTHNASFLDKFKCFSCNTQGNAIDFVRKIRSFSDNEEGNLEAAKDICAKFGLSYDDVQATADPEFVNYTSVYDYVASLFVSLYNSGHNPNRDYFKSRGLSYDLIKDFKLGYCPEYLVGKDGKELKLLDVVKNKFPDIDMSEYGLFDSFGNCVFSGRYIIPIKNKSGKVIAFSGRHPNPTDSIPKYKNSINTKFFNKSFTLFNYDKAKVYQTVIVVEGYMDAMSLVQSGFPNVVAAMGTAFGNTHLSLLKGKDIVLSLDSDEAGQSNTLKIIEEHRDIKFNVFVLPKFKDFNECLMSDTSINTLYTAKNLITAPEYLIKYLKSHCDLSSLADRSMCWKRMANLLGNTKRPGYPINTQYDPIEYDYYWKHLVRLLKGGEI